jgi:hypothetical protein
LRTAKASVRGVGQAEGGRDVARKLAREFFAQVIEMKCVASGRPRLRDAKSVALCRADGGGREIGRGRWGVGSGAAVGTWIPQKNRSQSFKSFKCGVGAGENGGGGEGGE